MPTSQIKLSGRQVGADYVGAPPDLLVEALEQLVERSFGQSAAGNW